MTVCVYMCVYISLGTCEGSEDEGGGGVCVCALSFIKPPTYL